MSNKSLVKIFQIGSAILIGVAAFFFWQGNNDGAFVSGVLVFVSFFLSYRYRLKEGVDVSEAERLERELDEQNINRSILQENTSLFDIEKNEFDEVKEKILENKQ